MSEHRQILVRLSALAIGLVLACASTGCSGDSSTVAAGTSAVGGSSASSGGAMGGAGGDGAGGTQSSSTSSGQTTSGQTTSGQTTSGQTTSGQTTSSGQGGAGGEGTGGSGGMAPTSKLSTLFDGVDEWVDMGDVYDFSDTTPFSVFLWLKTSTVQNHFLVGKRLLDMNKTGWQIALNGPVPKIAIDIQEKASSRIDVTVSTMVPFDGQWHHIGFTYNGSGMAAGSIIYLDGLPLAAEVHADTLKGSFNTTAPFTFGAKGGTGKWFDGHMDEVTVYAAALSAAEVAALYNGGAPTDPTALSTAGNVVGYWKMGDGDSFPTINDHGPFSYHGTMKNMEAADFVADTPP